MARRKGLITYSKRAAMELARVRGRSRRRIFLRLLGIALVIAIILLDRSEVLGPRTDDHGTFHQQQAIVTRVIDGDTLVVQAAGQEVHVRLIGIDAPETDAVFGDESTRHLKQIAEGKAFTLYLTTPQTRDRYRRLLAYLFNADGSIVNEQLVRDGAAYAHRVYPHPWEGVFISAEADARKKQRGLWAVVSDEDQPQWRREWLEELRRERRELEGWRN